MTKAADLNDPEMQDVWEAEGYKAVDTGETCPYPVDTLAGRAWADMNNMRRVTRKGI